MSWLISAQMALRFIAVLLKMTIKTNALDTDSCDTAETEKKEDVLNETFESISSINDDSTLEDLDSSYANFAGYGMKKSSDDVYANSSTPKRGHNLPLWIQNQLYNANRTHSSFCYTDSSWNTIPVYGRHGRFGEGPCNYLNESLTMDTSDVDSINGSLDDLEMTHEERLKYKRSLDKNVMKLEEKCELLEDNNSKLRKTLHVIMKENKDLSEKLRVTKLDKSKITRELQELEHKLQMVAAAKKALESNLNDVNDEKTKVEAELKRCLSEVKQIEINNNGLRRQISMQDDENESIRQQLVKIKTELAESKADREMLSRQVQETQDKHRFIEEELEEMTKEHTTIITKLKGFSKMLEKVMDETESEESGNEVRRSSCNAEATFETELFVAIEKNVRVEGIVNEVKEQMNEMINANGNGSKNSIEKGKREKLRIVEPKGNVCKRKGGQLSRNGETKTSTLRRAKSLKSERKSSLCSKEGGDVAPRGSKIKELMNEKLKIENDYKELMQKHEKSEEELKTAKTQIEMLVKECGILDHQLVSIKKQIGRNDNDKLHLEKADLSKSNESSLFLRTREINELEVTQEEIKEHLKMSQNKIQELESELATSKDRNAVAKRHMKEMERKYEAAKKELHHYEAQSYNQNIENTRLRDHVIHLNQELGREQQRIDHLNRKLTTLKEKSTTQIRKLECEMMKYVKKLDRYKERDRRQNMKRLETSAKDSSEADSGLIPDHIDDIIDLT